MAETQDMNGASEPSMEEILASIRRIIADEKEPAAPESVEGADTVDLTQMVQDDGAVVDLTAKNQDEPVEEVDASASVAKAAIDDTLEVAFEPIPEPTAPSREFEIADRDTLLSDQAADMATSALASLVHTVQHEKQLLMPSHTLLGNGARTLEEIVLELLRPILKDWLDQNLPTLVDRLVQKEVEKLIRRAQMD